MKGLLEDKRVYDLKIVPDLQNAKGRADVDKIQKIDIDVAQIEGAIEVKMGEFKPGSKVKANGLLRPKDFKAGLPFTQSIVYACRLPGLARDFSFAALGELQGLRITDVSPPSQKSQKYTFVYFWVFPSDVYFLYSDP